MVFNSDESGNFLLNVNGLIETVDFLIIVSIGFELSETVKLYLKENLYQGEVILMASLIAIAWKVIISDYSKGNPLTISGIESIIIAVFVWILFNKKNYIELVLAMNIHNIEPTPKRRKFLGIGGLRTIRGGLNIINSKL